MTSYDQAIARRTLQPQASPSSSGESTPLTETPSSQAVPLATNGSRPSSSALSSVEPVRPSGGRHYLGRLRHYAALWKRGVHFKLAVANLLSGLLPDVVSGAVRGRLYRWAGFAIADGVFLMGKLNLTSAAPGFYEKLEIGPGVTIADNVTINLDAKVTIGKNVALAPHVLIYTGSHRIGPGSMRLGRMDLLPVRIEDGAWIRLGAIIVPGVTIGRGSIVAAGAVVLKDVPPNTYVEGNPAQVIRKLGWGDR
jgi:acetyltransferase-like isoleucine patch superfamily enzyme